MNICIGGDLEGRTVDLKKAHFIASEVEDGKASEYRKKTYIIDDKLYYFWISTDLSLSEATEKVESILKKAK